MKVWVPILLLVGGAAIAAIVWWGNQATSRKSDAEILQDAMLDMQAAERDRAATAAELSAQILPVPASCDGLTTAFIFDVCETEPDPGKDWPDWTNIASEAEQACIRDAFVQTNAHAYAIQGRDETAAPPTSNQAGNFISDICTASIFTEGVDYGDPDAPVALLIGGYYADRAESIFKPGHDY